MTTNSNISRPIFSSHGWSRSLSSSAAHIQETGTCRQSSTPSSVVQCGSGSEGFFSLLFFILWMDLILIQCCLFISWLVSQHFFRGVGGEGWKDSSSFCEDHLTNLTDLTVISSKARESFPTLQTDSALKTVFSAHSLHIQKRMKFLSSPVLFPVIFLCLHEEHGSTGTY